MDWEQLGPLFVIGIGLFALAGMALALVIWWKIIGRTGYPTWLAILMFIPLANLILLIVLAFQEWPIQRELAQLKGRPAP